MDIRYFSNSEPINRLNPTKCPFCSPSTLMCSWGGHKQEAPKPPAATRTTIYQVKALAYYPDGQRRVSICVRSTDDVPATLRVAFGEADFRDLQFVELPLYSGPSIS